jgi:hypothetical protein
MTQAATLAQLASSGALSADTSGNVGVGTSAPDNIFHVAKASTSTSVGSSTSTVRIQNTQSSALGETSGVEFFNRNPLGSAKLAGVYGVYENYNATGYAGALAFATESIGATNVTERMRIDSSGSVGVGLTPNSTYRLHVRGAGATSGTVSFLTENSSGTSQLFLRNDNFFNSGAIANYSVAGTGLVIDVNNFVGKTTSSLRYKKDIVEYNKGLTALNLLRPVYYKSAVEGPNGVDSKQHAGFVAEEIADAGFEEFLVRDLEGNPDAIQYAHITALLVASIKELKAELDVCKAEIAALKGV